MVSVRVPYRLWESPFPSLCLAFSCWFSKTCGVDSSTGSVSTVTVPLIITSVITVVNPSETQYASCPSTSTTINTATSTSPQQSPTTTITITTTPPATTLTWIPAASSQPSKSSSSIAPIAGGAAGGFILLVSAVALAWFIWCVSVCHLL